MCKENVNINVPESDDWKAKRVASSGGPKHDWAVHGT